MRKGSISPLGGLGVGVVWSFVGDAHVIDQRDQMERPWIGARPPSFYLRGVRSRPRITWNPGEVYSAALGFLPDALSAMTGLDLISFSGRAVPAEEALPQPMLGACRNFFEALPRC